MFEGSNGNKAAMVIDNQFANLKFCATYVYLYISTNWVKLGWVAQPLKPNIPESKI